ncbi:Uma2 family endonuclease [Sorangium sp. So ce1078]|uniref:Uma2 family endonuclease n=1 Tax=Sorangium sp. So ce1078 TaxID=3133329 RepID=UPI003F5DB81C
MSAVSGRKPDASAYMPQSRKPPRRGAINAPPDIMVEVVSPTPRDARRDRVEKLHEYASFGVRWYWIIDPQERTLDLLELGADRRYVRARSAADGSSAVFPAWRDSLSISTRSGARWSYSVLNPAKERSRTRKPSSDAALRAASTRTAGRALDVSPSA